MIGGDWAALVREVARYDWDAAERVREWPLREVCLAYLERMRCVQAEHYRHEVLVWALLAPHSKTPKRAPEPPKMLRENP